MSDTNKTKITSVVLNDNDSLVVGENINRLSFYISVTGGDCWVKFSDIPTNDRRGMMIRETSPFPFSTMPDVAYYGTICAINAVDGQAPTIHITELIRE